MAARPDWQLPEGVNRGLWDYIHDEGIARRYDEGLAGSSLFDLDLQFVEEYAPKTGRPGRLLDMGCGTGRLLARLGSLGWQGVGVDLSHPMLVQARDKGRSVGATISLIEANLTDLGFLPDATFDLAACLFSTLGMVTGEGARKRVIREAWRVLKPGGRWIVHVHNRWFHLYNGPGPRWLLEDTLRRWKGRKDVGDRVMPVHQGIAGLTLHLFTRREIVGLLRDGGFRVLEARPISLAKNGKLAGGSFLGGWRAYGFLIAAEKGG